MLKNNMPATRKFKRSCLEVVLVMIISVLGSSAAFSQSEDELDSMVFSADAAATEKQPEKSGESGRQIFGFIENSNQAAFPMTEDPSEYEIIKLEARLRINALYTSGSFQAKASVDGYFYPEYNENGDGGSGGNETRIEAREIYVAGGENLRFKIGKQLFSWGTADLFSITNYLDQRDLREFFSRSISDNYRGVPALSLKYIYGNMAFEAALSPLHNPALMPRGFWELDPSMENFPEITINNPEAKEADIRNMSYVLRAGGSIKGLDFHLSYFNGINNDLIFSGKITGNTYDQRAYEVTPCFSRRQTVGLDTAFTVKKLSVRTETVFSPDMPYQDYLSGSRLERIIDEWKADPSKSFDEIYPGQEGIRYVPYLQYVLGMDYSIRGGNSMLLMEWVQGFYLIKNSNNGNNIFSHLMAVRYFDTFMQGFLQTECGAVVRPVQWMPGSLLYLELGLNFQNGFVLSAGGYFIFGNNDALFEYLDRKDMVYLKARFSF